LLVQVMDAGKRSAPPPTLADSRKLAQRELEQLPDYLRQLEVERRYPVTIAPSLERLAAETDLRILRTEEASSRRP